jgi:hypothetical protein
MPEFINCPRCGARNFADDQSCSVCGIEFTPIKAELDPKPAPIPWIALLVVGVVIILISIVLDATLFHKKYNHSTHYVSNRNSPSRDTSRVKYSIDEVEKRPPYCVINVRLKNKISTERLEALSEKLKNDPHCDADKIRIFYRLLGTELGNGVWARVDYDSAFSLQFLSLSLEQEEYAETHKGNLNIIGAWEDNTSGASGAAVRIRKNSDGKLIMEYYQIVNPDSEDPMPTELKEVHSNGKTFFKSIEPDNTGEYYSIQSNGDLAWHDKKGDSMVLKKL